MYSADTLFVSRHGNIISKTWGDECAVYLTASGETHLLETTTANLLITVINKPTTFQQLLSHLEKLFPDNEISEIQPYLLNTLSELKTMGLVEVNEETGNCN